MQRTWWERGMRKCCAKTQPPPPKLQELHGAAHDEPLLLAMLRKYLGSTDQQPAPAAATTAVALAASAAASASTLTTTGAPKVEKAIWQQGLATGSDSGGGTDCSAGGLISTRVEAPGEADSGEEEYADDGFECCDEQGSNPQVRGYAARLAAVAGTSGPEEGSEAQWEQRGRSLAHGSFSPPADTGSDNGGDGGTNNASPPRPFILDALPPLRYGAAANDFARRRMARCPACAACRRVVQASAQPTSCLTFLNAPPQGQHAVGAAWAPACATGAAERQR